MYIVPTNRWAVDVAKTDSAESMAECLIGNIGTPQEFVSVVIEGADGLTKPIAFCDPRHAATVAAAPFMKAALEAVARYLDDSEANEADSNRILKPVALGMVHDALKMTRSE